jgi:uncharacterized protein
MRRAKSRYTICVPLRDRRCLAYNGLSGALAVWTTDEADAYERIGDDTPASAIDPATLSALERGGYVVREDVDELAVLQGQYEGHRFRRDVMTLTIAPTLACNFGCDYCFQGQDKPSETMSPQVQDAIIDLVRLAAPGITTLGVAWYGGEPLLRLKVIESLSDRLLELCRARGLRYEASMVTNGYSLDAEAARSLHARGLVQVQVTLDGARADHDARRHLLSRKGTFDRITRNLREVADAVPGLAISVRVNIDDRNAGEIRGLLDHLAALGLGNRKNFKVYFAPVEAITEGCHEVAEVCLSKSRYGQLEAELYQHGFSLGLTQLPYPPRFHGTCAAVKPKGFVIAPNGDVHKCWDTITWPDRRVGTVFAPDKLAEDERALRWLRWTPFDNETCKNCKLLPNCAGACAYKFVHAGLTRGEAAILPCPSWKYNIKERLLHRAVAMTAITADDFDAEATRTDPSELCADVLLQGKALPAEMQALYDQQKKRKRLPLLPPLPAAPGAPGAL